MTKLHDLADLGQAIWFDYIRRSIIESGELDDLVAKGIRGLTSNPSIFEKAVAGSDDYDPDLLRWHRQGRSTQEIYEALVIRDIQMAADVLRPVYDRTSGLDGFVSLEVSPELAYDVEGTVQEARRLFAAVDRPNLMIKVPATAEGIPAVRTLISEGVNVNVTLMFSLERYEAVAEAFMAGLEALEADDSQGSADVDEVASVASFFVSRVDVMVDALLEQMDAPFAEDLKGAAGIANAKMAYQRFKGIFGGDRWKRLADRGARVQRLLWASTSTKDPAYSDTMYPDNLIGAQTINTLPPDTLVAFLDHGTVAATLETQLAIARAELNQLAQLGIDLDQVTDDLLEEGVDKFAQSFSTLLDSIDSKVQQLTSE